MSILGKTVVSVVFFSGIFYLGGEGVLKHFCNLGCVCVWGGGGVKRKEFQNLNLEILSPQFIYLFIFVNF